MCKIYFFVFSILFIANGIAQDIPNSAMVEQTSSQLYFSKNWAELIKYGNKAITYGVDYYYLRFRIGVACYEQKNYRNAAGHFEKALEFNSDDSLSLEYLYYSYVFSGRNNEARALTSMFSTTLRDKIKPPGNKYIESVYAEGGFAPCNLNDKFKNIDINGPANIYGEATITNIMQYWHIGLNHQLGNKTSIYQGYSNIKIDMARKINTNNKDTIDNYSLAQHDYYLSVVHQFKHFSFSPAFHLINVNFGKLNANYDIFNSKYLFKKKDTSFVNYATSLSLTKNIGVYTFNLTGGFSQLNGYNQIQTGLSLTYYPVTSANIYGTSSLFYLNENNTNRIIAAQKLGIKIIPKLWSEAEITLGNLQNYCENNAFAVFNTGDKIVYKYGLAITSPLLKHVEFSLRYECFSRENTYYRTNDLYKIESVNISYKTQTIIGGIKWKL